ncbi:MAG TPA: DUF3826 domain-containing protein [Bacteroidales bacterium]
MNKLTKRYKGILILWLFVLTAPGFAQKAATQQEKDAAYTKVITQRAAKIVAALGINDSLKAKRVQEIIVSQYHNLSEIHDTRNEQVKAVKADSTKSKEEKNTLLKKIDSERDAKLAKLHSWYLSELSKELTQEQVDKIKDGMTYGKVQFTYNGYLQMILNLTDVQKKQILDWLIEARELAMDAGSSEEKTAIFGKYKGRIANYLSAQGYDLKKEQEERNKRIKDANAK